MELIKINENQGNQVVNARDLHEYLESNTKFSMWIERRIEEYGFVENEDFALLPNFGNQKTKGGHNRKDYAISLDMAKELSMVERNEKGRQARKYFIKIEKRAVNDLKEGLANRIKEIKKTTIKAPKKVVLMDCKAIQKRIELLEIIKHYLTQGDVKAISKEKSTTYSIVTAVLRGRRQNKEILTALHKKALSNKASMLFSYEQMIKELKK